MVLICYICRPPDNDRYVRTAPDNPKKVGTLTLSRSFRSADVVDLSYR